MPGRKRKELKLPEKKGDREMFDLKDFVSAGRVAASGRFIGSYLLFVTNDQRSPDVVPVGELKGTPRNDQEDWPWSYQELELPEDYMWAGLHCLEDVETDGSLRVYFTGNLR
jgi:hypothetical protein